MQYFPLFFDLKNKSVLIIGGGEVASRKVDMLVRAGADVTIVSPTLNSQLKPLVENHVCHWVSSDYQPELISEKFVQVDERVEGSTGVGVGGKINRWMSGWKDQQVWEAAETHS